VEKLCPAIFKLGSDMSANLVNLYEEEYVRKFEANQSSERLRRLLPLMDFGPQCIVADFACGNGMLMEFVAPMVREYVGVDFSQRFIEAANRKRDRLAIRNASFVCARIEDFCAQYPEYFDIALAMDASEHIPDGEWTSILGGIRSSLKSGGKLYVHTPNADFFLEIMKSKNFLVKQLREHVAVRTPSRNAEMLYKAGFSKVDTILLPHYNFLKYLHPVSFLPKVGKYFKARIFVSAEK
jgi:2-polyprenyl-6-hydroxyphenyl methylase / 3-demethylubiquinone-9 3-methyltransferase